MTVAIVLSKLSPVATNTVAEDDTSSSLRTYQGSINTIKIRQWLGSRNCARKVKHTLSTRFPDSLLRKTAIMSLRPLIARRTICHPWGERKATITASLSRSNVSLPCLGASHGLQMRTNANHLSWISGVYRDERRQRVVRVLTPSKPTSRSVPKGYQVGYQRWRIGRFERQQPQLQDSISEFRDTGSSKTSILGRDSSLE